MTQLPRRFFVPPGSLRARNVTLGPDLAHRLGRVLRLKRGDRVLLSEGGTHEYEVQLTGVSPYAITGVVVTEREAPPEPEVTLVLYQSLIRANRFDLVLEKGTEIGVSRFVPVIAARSQVQGTASQPPREASAGAASSSRGPSSPAAAALLAWNHRCRSRKLSSRPAA